MSLVNLITEIENETWKITEDTDLTTVIRIKEELAACEQNEARATLFSDTRQLADIIIKKYLNLDQEDRQKMAEVYETESCFKRIGGIRGQLRKNLTNQLGKQKLKLLSHISNYSKLIPILRRYIDYVVSAPRIDVLRHSLCYYLRSHNKYGKEVDIGSNQSLRYLYDYDYKNFRKLKTKSNIRLLKWIAYGISRKLKEELEAASTFLKFRKKILENYLKYINKINKRKGTTLSWYLYTHDENDKEVKPESAKSLKYLAKFDFKNMKYNDGLTSKNVLESLIVGLDSDFQSKILKTKMLQPTREKMLKNYVKWIQSLKNPKPIYTSLEYYLTTHDIERDKVSRRSRGSLVDFTNYDFINMRCERKRRGTSLFDSITFGVSSTLKRQVKEAEMLLPIRIKVAEHYLEYLATLINLRPSNSSLFYYLSNFNIRGVQVTKGSTESLWAFVGYDFKNRKTIRKKKDGLISKFCYGMTKTLRKKIKEAQTLVSVRERILQNYVHHVENSQNLNKNWARLGYYLMTHNLSGGRVREGDSDCLQVFYHFDFRNCKTHKKLSTQSTVDSMVYNINNNELIEKVRKYNSGKIGCSQLKHGTLPRVS